MEIFKSVLYVIASLIMAGIVILAPEIADSVCIFYVGILTTYLGLDVWGMIKSTSLLPPGEYKDIKIWRYVVCALSYAVIICIAYFVSVNKGVEFRSLYSVFSSAIFLLISILIGGLEGNKIATGTEKKGDAE